LCGSVCRSRPCNGLIPVQVVLPTVYRIKILKKRPGPKGCRAIESGRERKRITGDKNVVNCRVCSMRQNKPAVNKAKPLEDLIRCLFRCVKTYVLLPDANVRLLHWHSFYILVMAVSSEGSFSS
jgi:hypothetical protein